MYICLYLYLCLYLFLCIYIFMYIYIYIHIEANIKGYLETLQELLRALKENDKADVRTKDSALVQQTCQAQVALGMSCFFDFGLAKTCHPRSLANSGL